MYIGGDFNCALNDNDRTTESNKDPSRAHLKKFIEQLDLKDAWFEKHTYTQYTFLDPVTKPKSRIESQKNLRKICS